MRRSVIGWSEAPARAVLAVSWLGLGVVPTLAQSSLLSPTLMNDTSTAVTAPAKPPAAIVLPPPPAVPAPAVKAPAPVAQSPAPPPPAPATPPPATSPPAAPQSPAPGSELGRTDPAGQPPAAPAATATGTPPPSTGPAAPASVAPVTPAVVAKKKRLAPPPPPRETALSSDPTPTLTSETFFTTAKASERYAAIADAGGWPEIPGPLSPGATGKAVATLRLRLAIEGDLGKAEGLDPADATSGMFSTKWGPELTAAVREFQTRHGLKETGIVAGATLKAMNVPARVRFIELASSAQRLAGRNFLFGDRYVVVNLPSASVEAVENGKVARRYVAVVGDPDHASPEVDSKVIAVNLNPTWTVPTSIIKNEIIPKMQRDPGYLSRAKIRVLDGAGNSVNPSSIDWTSQRATNYILRQDSGSANSLGNIRINMPNKYSVYMHDTPSKKYFSGDYRFLSHGCVRVQGVFDLAAWLLQGTGGAPGGTWDRAAIEKQIGTGTHQEVRLSQPVQVAWVYLTGWADAQGRVQFRDDVYGIDTVGTNAQAQADPDPIGTIVNRQP